MMKVRRMESQKLPNAILVMVQRSVRRVERIRQASGKPSPRSNKQSNSPYRLYASNSASFISKPDM